MEEKIYSQLIDYIQGRSSQKEREYLFDLIERDDAVAEAFYQLQEIYHPTDLRWNNVSAWEKWKKNNTDTRSHSGRTITLFSFKNVLKIAAVTIPLIIVLGIFLRPDGPGEVAPDMIAIATGIGETKTVDLPDGTHVTLNENSSLEYEAKFTNRDVRFEGEGLFDVAKDPERTFSVSNRVARVSVLGTQFNINSVPKAGVIEVTVLEGKVKMESTMKPSEFVLLEKNDLGFLETQTNKISKKLTNAENTIAWKTKVLNYENQSLKQVVADLEKVYKIEFEYSDNRIADCTYKVNFQNYSVDQVIEALEFALGGEITYDQSKWLIDAEPCN